MERENNLKLHKEYELLFCCARMRVDPKTEDKIISLIHEDLDWQHLILMATRHKLMPLLYYNLDSICPELVPEEILAELRDYYNCNVRKNLLLTGELIKIIKLFKTNGIDAISYKGPVLANLAYGNISLREFNDIDIFIRKKDSLKIIEILNSKGCILNFDIIKNLEEVYFKSQKGFIFRNKNSNISIDFQWKFSGNFYSFNSSPESILFNNLNNISFKNHDISVFSPENTLLILSLHAAGHQWSRLSWIVDIAELINKYDLNWEEIVENSNKLNIKRILKINLILACEILGAKIPKLISKNIYSDKLAVEISIKIQENIYSENLKSSNLVEWFYFHLKIRENLKNAIIDSIKHLTIPSIEELKLIKLSKVFYFVYFFIKPLYLIKRFNS